MPRDKSQARPTPEVPLATRAQSDVRSHEPVDSGLLLVDKLPVAAQERESEGSETWDRGLDIAVDLAP